MKNILLLSMLISAVAFGQESVNTTGGTGTGSGGTTSYSVGQVAYTTISDGAGTINQGVQQTYTVMIDSTFGFEELSDLNMNVFPNPTTDVIQLSIEDLKDKQLSYTLLDASQKTVLTDQISTATTSLDFTEYGSGTYFLYVMDNSGNKKIFKIIKQ